jgi:hypothetical protein
MRRHVRSAAIATSLVLAAGLVGSGIGLASSSSNGFKACANKHGTLSLLTKGTCAKHFRKVSIGARGPAGPSDVYVATGAATVVVDLRHPAVTGTSTMPYPLSLPAGSYLVNWQVETSGFKHTPGPPAGQVYTLKQGCAPSSTSGANVRYGPPDAQASSLMSDDYNTPSNTTSFDFDTTLRNVWALKVPSGGAQLSVACEPSSLVDATGTTSTADSEFALAHLAATKVATLHGSDPVIAP